MRDGLEAAEVDSGAVVTTDDMAALAREDCAAAILNRTAPVAFRRWIDALAPESLPAMRKIMPVRAVDDAVRGACAAAGTPECDARAWMIADIAALARGFAALMRAAKVRVRLDVVTGDACRRFHRDAVTARLICAYRGAGTQYGVSVDGQAPEVIEEAPRCAPILLRGLHWPERPRSGLVHRSPPLAGSGETRLLLVIDPIFDEEDAA